MHAKRQERDKLEGMGTHLSGVAFVVDEDHTELEQSRIQSHLGHLGDLCGGDRAQSSEGLKERAYKKALDQGIGRQNVAGLHLHCR